MKKENIRYFIEYAFAFASPFILVLLYYWRWAA